MYEAVSSYHNEKHLTGYIRDLLDHLMIEIDSAYELYLSRDFGHLQPGGVWSGIMGELTQKVSLNFLKR